MRRPIVRANRLVGDGDQFTEGKKRNAEGMQRKCRGALLCPARYAWRVAYERGVCTRTRAAREPEKGAHRVGIHGENVQQSQPLVLLLGRNEPKTPHDHMTDMTT